MASFNFLSSHGRALKFIAADSSSRLKDIADHLGITKRHAHGIVKDLCADGYVAKKRDGRRNRYEIVEHRPTPGHGGSPLSIGDVLTFFSRSIGTE